MNHEEASQGIRNLRITPNTCAQVTSWLKPNATFSRLPCWLPWLANFSSAIRDACRHPTKTTPSRQRPKTMAKSAAAHSRHWPSACAWNPGKHWAQARLWLLRPAAQLPGGPPWQRCSRPKQRKTLPGCSGKAKKPGSILRLVGPRQVVPCRHNSHWPCQKWRPSTHTQKSLDVAPRTSIQRPPPSLLPSLLTKAKSMVVQVLSPQLAQDVRPSWSAKVPNGHRLHAVAPVSLAKRPNAQSLQPTWFANS